MRLDDPADIYSQLNALWQTVSTPSAAALTSPFDLISAELIRSDKKLNILFSRDYGVEQCATTNSGLCLWPAWLRKSTILRMLSLSALFASGHAEERFPALQYVGVYISCSSELRSRFWLFPEESYEGNGQRRDTILQCVVGRSSFGHSRTTPRWQR